MYTERQQKGIARFRVNPYWRSMFDNAPSDEARLYYAESFASGLATEDEGTLEDRIAIYRKLSPRDWDYIIENCHNNLGRWGLRQNRLKYGDTAMAMTT